VHIHFVTGRLAQHALKEVVSELAARVGFKYSIDVLNITVAALMTPQWIAPRIAVPPGTDRILLPGYCEGDLSVVEQVAGVPVRRGPRDLRRLPEYFGDAQRRDDYGAYNIEIIAEINHVPRRPLGDVLAEARRLAAEGADLIDVGCDPGMPWSGVADVVRALKGEGLRVSIDSLNPAEIEPAVRAGAELVLSVNRENRAAAPDWGCEVVVIPDVAGDPATLDETVDYLDKRNVKFRIDPVLAPIGFGFAESLAAYVAARKRYPEVEMMMGIGNLTELTDADSAAINVLLLGFCQELAIRSVLTTEVIHWARSSVRECDLARRLVHYAVSRRVLPKHIEPQLIPLRGEKPLVFAAAQLERLASEIKDNNYRIFAEEDRLHLISAGLHLEGDDPFLLFDDLLSRQRNNVDPKHAFYLGYEMAKAVTALTLDKEYRQDEALEWGFLTRPEKQHRLKRRPHSARDAGQGSTEESA
jgi:dihydropteroate synthase-like protein